MKKEMNVNGTTQEERGGLSASASTTDDQVQNRVEQATDSCGILSTDTTFDTTAQRPWTPGPWKLFDYVDCSDVTCAKGFFVTRVTTTKGLECFTSLDTIRANARLIAAAPDLFEALAALVDVIQSLENDGGIDLNADALLADARAAMDKALGVKR